MFSSCLELRTKDYFNIHWEFAGGTETFQASALYAAIYDTLSYQ